MLCLLDLQISVFIPANFVSSVLSFVFLWLVWHRLLCACLLCKSMTMLTAAGAVPWGDHDGPQQANHHEGQACSLWLPGE